MPEGLSFFQLHKLVLQYSQNTLLLKFLCKHIRSDAVLS